MCGFAIVSPLDRLLTVRYLLRANFALFCISFVSVTCFDSSTDASALAPHFIAKRKQSLNKESRTLNKFESGLKLGHEPLYILNRKKQKVSWLGVSLPRPSLVSVPVEV